MAALLASSLAALPMAQCPLALQVPQGLQGFDGYPFTQVLWDADGSGPAQPILAFGGSFAIAGTTLSSGVAAVDPNTSQWLSLAGGLQGAVYALAALPNGDLIAGGDFMVSATGTAVARVARWDGSAWTALGAGVDGVVRALAILPNGDLIVGGDFGNAGGAPASKIARWNGTTWSPLGSGTNGPVVTLKVRSNGDLVAGGDFLQAGGTTCNFIASWNGSSWTALGAGVVGSGTLATGGPGVVNCLAELPNGDLLVGGYFSHAGGQLSPGLARWNSGSWYAWPTFGTTFNSVQALVVDANGDVLTTKDQASKVIRWNGNAWTDVGNGGSFQTPFFGPPPSGPTGRVKSLLALANGELWAAGIFRLADGATAQGLARWSANAWQGLPGIDGSILSIAQTSDGATVVGSRGRQLGTVSGCIARRVAGTWTAMGSGIQGEVAALLPLPDGDVIAGGLFTAAGGVATNNIAHWDLQTNTWSALGAGVSGNVYALARLPNGDVVAGGLFTAAGGVAAARIARWNGSTWSPLGAGVSSTNSTALVYALAVLPNGELVAGGSFTHAGGAVASNIARWNGNAWTALGNGTNSAVFALTTRANGDLVAGGWFTSAGTTPAAHIAAWNGSTWSAFGLGMSHSLTFPRVATLATLPNGDLVVGGEFTAVNGVPARRLARWSLGTWSELAGGLDASAVALAVDPAGTLLVGGDFRWVANTVSVGVATLTSTCPATSTIVGAACAGSGGANALAATNHPWLGSTWETVGTGLASPALAVRVFGTSGLSIPLATLLPSAAAGCSLLAAPDVLDPTITTSGTVNSSLPLPPSPGLAGIQVYHQLVMLEVDPSFTILQTTSTNAVVATLGVF